MATIYCKESSQLPKRRDYDHYPTDETTVRMALQRFLFDMGLRYHRLIPTGYRPRLVLDPGCGDGVWGRVLNKLLSEPASIIGTDVRDVVTPEGYKECVIGDYCDEWIQSVLHGQAAHQGGYDLIMGNPPYRHAEEFVKTSWDLLNPSGHLLFLMRLTFLEGQRRGRGLWRWHGPHKVWICSRRPSFTGDGKTSPDAYAVIWWWKGHSGLAELGWLRSLDTEP